MPDRPYGNQLPEEADTEDWDMDSFDWESFLHYTFAIVALLYVFIGALVAAFRTDRKPGSTRYRRRIHLAVFLLVIASYVANAFTQVFYYGAFDEGEPQLLQLLVLAFAWSWVAFRPSDPVSIPCGTAIISTLFEIPILVLLLQESPRSALDITQVVLQSIRFVLFLAIVASALRNKHATFENDESIIGEPSYRDDEDEGEEDVESIDLLTGDFDSDDEDDTAGIERHRAKRLKEAGGWFAYLKDFSIFIPYMIPKKNRKVQLCFLISLLCVMANRVLNVLIPRQIGIVTDRILDTHSPPYDALAVWLLLSMVDEFRGMALIKALVKIPIEQFSQRKITNAAFNHVMTLSMDFHSDRDAAEVMKAIEQGSSLNSIFEVVAVELLPMVADIIIAMGLFWWKINGFAALIILVAAVLFTTVESALLKKNMKNKRDVSIAERNQSRVMHQAVQGWQTVTYFNMFGFEKRRYAEVVETHLTASRKYEILDALNEVVLEILDPITFFLLGSLVLYEVSQGQASTGDFIFVLQYWQMLVWPIKFLTHNYKQILGYLVDAERLLALLKTKPTVADRDGAKDFYSVEGSVSFHDVCFSYNERKPTVQNLSFSASAGQTIAFVGATGAGKSTIAKLLLRFYDIDSGSITIDGHDIRDLTLSSLRSSIGVVPQDPLLFNASILENLRYARPDATEQEIFDACRKAVVHDKIMSFADGYETKVGENGVKLSGGEIQRLAIARVFLKNPPILILDEATSAIDTETEHKIQTALDVLKKGRTTFVIAHRLSTIVAADQIMVISDGQIVEKGTHTELVKAGGKYNSLWAKQSAGVPIEEPEPGIKRRGSLL